MINAIPADVATHLNYQTGMFLTSDYMTLEQDYFSNWFKLQNRYLYTPGVLSGMLVTQQGNALAVSAGVAFDPDGNFLILTSGATPLTVPPNVKGTAQVYARYPDAGKSSADVVDEAATLEAAATVPAGAILLATVTLDANHAITAVTDSRVPVTSRLPAVLGGGALDQPLQGTAPVPLTGLREANASTKVAVSYLPAGAGADAFSQPPLVIVTVNGTVPYATAVQAGTAQFTVTLMALAAPQPDATELTLSWVAIANQSR